jgi:hypothetical protein
MREVCGEMKSPEASLRDAGARFDVGVFVQMRFYTGVVAMMMLLVYGALRFRIGFLFQAGGYRGRVEYLRYRKRLERCLLDVSVCEGWMQARELVAVVGAHPITGVKGVAINI